MLLQNITLHAQYPYQRRGGTTVATEAGNMRSQMGIRGASQLTRFVGDAQFVQKYSIPMGYSVGYAWFPAIKPGGLAATAGSSGVGSAVGTLTLGKPLEATVVGTGTVANAPLGLIVSALATVTAGGSVADADLVGVVWAQATVEGSGSLVGTPTLGAKIDMEAVVTGSGSVDATLTAIAVLSATVYVNEGAATLAQMAAAVWSAEAAANNEAGSMGQKVNAAGTSGDPWTANLDGYAAGSAGDKLKKGMTKGEFIALK